MAGPRSSPTDFRSSKLSCRHSSSTGSTDGRMGAQRFAGTPGPRCARFRPWSGMPWPAVELWGTMKSHRSPDGCAHLEHDLEGPGRTKRHARMGVGGGVGGTASARTSYPLSFGSRGGRRKRRRPDGRHERARSLAKRIRRPEGVNGLYYFKKKNAVALTRGR